MLSPPGASGEFSEVKTLHKSAPAHVWVPFSWMGPAGSEVGLVGMGRGGGNDILNAQFFRVV